MARTVIGSDKAEETRRRIIAAAAELFAEHGYHATSLNDVIAAAGSTKGGFYFHFPSKAELALAVLVAAENLGDRLPLVVAEMGMLMLQLRRCDATDRGVCLLTGAHAGDGVAFKVEHLARRERPSGHAGLRCHSDELSLLDATVHLTPKFSQGHLLHRQFQCIAE
jgi:AcrR family transcriptional regulator